MTFDEILECYKNSVTGSEMQRINYLSRKDLHRIVEQFKIKRRRKVPKRDDDLVDLWVKNMQVHGDDSPVALFKREGTVDEQLNVEDFMIVIITKFQKNMAIKNSGKNICVDSIRGASSHSFTLTTLLTIDELSSAFPVAFCISSKTDEISMRVFYESVKRIIGTIETPVFMSNDDSTFYDAWEEVMSPSSHQLLCKWHVDNCWRKELEKISDEDKRTSVYKTLRMLLEESDVCEFESSVNNFVTELEDISTRKFAEYFCKNYLPRVKMWAFCYMRHLGICSIEPLEAMHTFLENLFLNGGEDDNIYNSQINLTIPALLTLIRDTMLSRLDEFLQCLPDDWTIRIFYGHRRGLKSYEITPFSNNSWSVKRFRRVEGNVVVTKNEECSLDSCPVKCSRCNICIHSFFCTCHDNLINLNICGHIHACFRFSTPCEYIKKIEKMLARSKSVKVASENDDRNGVIAGKKETFDAAFNTNEIGETSIEYVIPSPPRTLLAGKKEKFDVAVNTEEVGDTSIDWVIPSPPRTLLAGKKEKFDVAVNTEEVGETFTERVIPSPSRTLLVKQLDTIKTMMDCAEFSEEHKSQLKNSFDAIISFMVMHGKSKLPYIRVPYQPSNNYVSTASRISSVQHQKQFVTVTRPVNLSNVNLGQT